MGNPDLSVGRFVVSTCDEWEGVLYDKSWPTREEAVEHGPAHILEVVGPGQCEYDGFFVCELDPVPVSIPDDLGKVIAERIHAHTFRGWEDPPEFNPAGAKLGAIQAAARAAVLEWLKTADIINGETCVVNYDPAPWPASV